MPVNQLHRYNSKEVLQSLRYFVIILQFLPANQVYYYKDKQRLCTNQPLRNNLDHFCRPIRFIVRITVHTNLATNQVLRHNYDQI